MTPRKAPPKRPKGADGVEVGDHVYARHPERGPIAVKVLAHGTHGFTGEDADRARHRMPWSHYLGHKARMLHRYSVVEQGADGALLEDDRGRRRFLAGQAPAPEASERASEPPRDDDPLTGGLDRLNLKKAMAMFPSSSRVLFLKAAVANAPGLSLRDVTDRAGHQTKRWMRTVPEQKGQGRQRSMGGEEDTRIHDPRQTDLEDFTGKPKQPPMRHGDVVQWRHGDVQGSGKIVASGADGITAQTPDGREHQVRHEHIEGPAAGGGGAGGNGGGVQSIPADQHDKHDEMDARPGADALIPPDKFSAAAHFKAADDPAQATPEAVLSGFPPDTAAKMNAILDKAKGVQETKTQHMKDGAYTPERQKLHETIIRGILSPEKIEAARPAPGEKPSFTILGGRGGSGKSWFKGQVYDPSKAIVLDADEIKHQLPEYAGWNAFQVHEESGDIFDAITDMAQKLGLNLVHDATMKTPKKAVALGQRFKDAGYRLEAHYMHLPRAEAAKRAVKRFLGPTGRFVPPEVILGNTQNEEAFDQVRQMADKWSFRDNTNSDGKGPKLISEGGTDAEAGKPGRDEAPPGRDGGENGRDGQPAGRQAQPGGGAGLHPGAARQEAAAGGTLKKSLLVLFRKA